jgi:hypothetical protein
MCAVGLAMPFAAGCSEPVAPLRGPECNLYVMSVGGGSLSGLQRGEPICPWEITGTPAAAGTYTFTVQMRTQPDELGETVGLTGRSR